MYTTREAMYDGLCKAASPVRAHNDESCRYLNGASIVHGAAGRPALGALTDGCLEMLVQYGPLLLGLLSAQA